MIHEKPQFDWRLKLGIALLSLSIILPLVGLPLVTSMNLSTTMITSISGGLLVAGELLGVTAIAVMGKEGYLFIKERLFGFFKQYGPSDEVSKTRYRIGLVMFFLPLLFGWISPYLIHHIVDQGQLPLTYAILGDILFLVSFFVLGGDFWDKIAALFKQKVKMCQPSDKIEL
jgi:hypothetical protein